MPHAEVEAMACLREDVHRLMRAGLEDAQEYR